MIGKTLSDIRVQLGFNSARSFYVKHLRMGGPLDFTYPYYMKIEGDRILPSYACIAAIANRLGTEHSNRLILAYCATIFPKHSSIFFE